MAGDSERCPACGTATGGDAWCGTCGLELAGSEAGELRTLAGQLTAAETQLRAANEQLVAARHRRDALASELTARRWQRGLAASAGAPFTEPAATPGSGADSERTMWPEPARRAGPEWNVERVRNLLLWTGATLLALSALAFTAVAWTHLGPGGRAALLVAFTALAAIGATATRSRLPATSGALTGLTIALALVDWQIVRRAGLGSGLSGSTWWAIGSAIVGAVCLALGRVAAPAPARRAVAVLGPLCGVLTAATVAHAAWSGALLLSLLAALLVAADRITRERVRDPYVHALVLVESIITWIVAAALAVGATFEPHTFVQTLTPAAVILTLALAPGLQLRRPSVPRPYREPADRTWLAAVVVGSALGALLTSVSTMVGAPGLLTVATVLGSAAFAIAPALTGVWTRGARVAGAISAAPGALLALSTATVVELGPIGWLHHAWTGTMAASAVRVVSGPRSTALRNAGWCEVGILAALALALVIATRPTPPVPAGMRRAAWHLRAIAAAVAYLAIALVPMAMRASALAACTVSVVGLVLALTGAAVASRRHPERAVPYGWLAVVPGVPALGWAASTQAASITVAAVVAVAALIAALVGREVVLRSAHVALAAAATATLAAVATLAAGASAQVAGFVVGTVSGAIVVIGSHGRRDAPDGITLEAVGGFGLVTALALASASATWVAATLTVATPMLLAASRPGGRRVGYGSAAAAAALGATWAWLASAGVTVVEAYTLPAAAAALGAGRLARREGPAHSWLVIGPALVLGLGPTLALARHDDTRAIAVGIAALLVLLEGARRRLQAPIALGVLTLVVLGIDKLGPQAARLPRWAMLAVAGLLLLWVGTTFERRRDDAVRAARHFERFG